jgi:L-rhamnose isomerase
MGYDSAKAVFAEWGVDTETAIARLGTIPISMHCWQGDDVVGFEAQTGTSGGGIQATGNHPGRARTPDELRADLEFAYSMIPGMHRLNLHAMYMDTDETPDRDEIEYKHFAPGWTGPRIRASASISTRPSLPTRRRTTT